jgi:hypothetical protein
LDHYEVKDEKDDENEPPASKRKNKILMEKLFR